MVHKNGEQSMPLIQRTGGQSLGAEEIDIPQQILPFFLAHAKAAVAIKDLNGRYLFANCEFGRYIDAPSVDVIGGFDREFLAPERIQKWQDAEQAAIQRQAVTLYEETLSRSGSNVSYVSTRFPILDEDHRMIALGVVAMDITGTHHSMRKAERALKTAEQVNAQLRHAVESLEQFASTDLLTSTWNRRRFEEVVEAEMDRSNRYGHPISLVLIDIDHFKNINDNHGHQEGDRVLVQVADCLRGAIRKSDSLTRWGGEEFIVLMPNTGLSHARFLAERIRDRIASRVFDSIGSVTVSVGVAEYVPATSRDDWLKRADRAMYAAKHAGRNRVEVDATRSPVQQAAEHLEGALVQLVWKEAFRSGDRLIDNQHRGLFHLSNELFDAVLSGRPADEFSILVARLLDAVVQHFQDEERILAELGFTGLQQHAGEHAKLLAKGRELAQQFSAGTSSVGALFQFLAYDVVTRHMLGADRDYFPLTASRAAAGLE
jgi:diguanylate cyclase (GGDEF)-like protein/hemerythrin-like metal-binding protein